MAMIKQDQDRLDCLRLAVQLIMPRSHGMPPKDSTTAALDAARQFYAFATGETNVDRK
jgi:hypothetical protein